MLQRFADGFASALGKGFAVLTALAVLCVVYFAVFGGNLIADALGVVSALIRTCMRA